MTNKVQPVPHFMENLDDLTIEEKKEILLTEPDNEAILTLLTRLNFDEGKPQNHNIKYINLKSKYAYIIDENHQWVRKDIDMLADMIYQNRISCMPYLYASINEYLDDNEKQIIEERLEKWALTLTLNIIKNVTPKQIKPQQIKKTPLKQPVKKILTKQTVKKTLTK